MPDRSHRRAWGRSETARSRPGTGAQPGRRHREPPPRETAVLHHRATRWASCRSKLRSLGSRSRLIGSGSSSSAGAAIGSRLLARVSTDELVACILAGRCCRRHAGSQRPRACCTRIRGERKLRRPGGLRRSDQLVDGFLADAQPMRDRSVAHALGFQRLDTTQTLPGDPSSTATPARLSTKSSHPALRIACLIPPHGAHRSGKRPRHVRLLREARFHQEHHRISLSDRVLGAIVMHPQSGEDDHALIRASWTARPPPQAHQSRPTTRC
jgi:hypothetical protein